MLHVKSFLSFVNYDTIQLGMNISSVLASQNEQLSGFRRILQKQLLYALVWYYAGEIGALSPFPKTWGSILNMYTIWSYRCECD